MAAFVEDERIGLTYEPGRPEALGAALSHSRTTWAARRTSPPRAAASRSTATTRKRKRSARARLAGPLAADHRRVIGRRPARSFGASEESQ